MVENDLISVVMPNYNTTIPFLAEAVDSILAQTYQNFEFIIVDDCSTDESYGFLQSLKDPRIHLIRNEKNMGVTASLNRGFRLAKGAYIARMDSDDISFPTRFERQLAFMTENPDVIVCGTFAEEIGDRNGKRCRKIPNMEEYQCGVLFGNVFGLIHPTAFFRAEELRKNHIQYDENIKTAQDYAMWATCVRYGRISNVEEVLFQYRIHGKQISSEKKDIQKRCTMYTMKQQLLHIIPDITDEEVKLHYEYCITNNISLEMKKWFGRIITANSECKYVNEEELSKFVDMFIQGKINAASMTANSPGKLIRLFFASGLKEKRVILNNILKRVSRRIPLMRLECGETVFSKLKNIIYNFKLRKSSGGEISIISGSVFTNRGQVIIDQGVFQFGKKNWKKDNRRSGLFIADGAVVRIHDSFSIYSGSYVSINEGATLEIAGNGYINHCASIDCFHRIVIGNNTIISKNVTLRDSDNHRISGNTCISSPIIIGDNVWIGMNTTVLKGVKIGDGTVIGANSVVTHDIPPGCVAVGNPCRVIKENIVWS